MGILRVDLFHDTVCPWCRIGHQHLKQALAQGNGRPIQIHYRAFFLNPAIPDEGYEFRPYMEAKGGGRIPLEGFFDAPRRMGAACGLTFNFERIERASNSLLSHRLIALTPEQQKEAMVEAIYAAYLEYGRDIGDLEVLLDIAAGLRLDGEDLRAQLEGEAGKDQVLAENNWARQHGINGVPFFIFDGRVALSGAQPPEVFSQVLQELQGE